MSSKRKKRDAEFKKRQAKRDAKKKRDQQISDALGSENIEEMANALGIRLK